MVLAGACCDGGPVERTSVSLPVPTTIARLVTSLVPQLVGVASLVVSSRRLGLPPLLFCSVGLPQGDARDRDLDEFPGNISANKKMQMHPASRLHPRGSSHSFSAGGSEERVFHGTRRHVRVPIRPQRPPAAAGKASLPPLPPTATPTAPRHPGAQGNKQHLLFLFLFLRRRPSALPSVERVLLTRNSCCNTLSRTAAVLPAGSGRVRWATGILQRLRPVRLSTPTAASPRKCH